MVVGEYHPAFEEYCETIFELREDDIDVIQARIAERMGVSRPAVSEMIKRMEGEGLVTATRTAIKLTVTGRSLAESIVRRNRLAERFLTDILGLSWADAHREAGKWEHVMSDSVEAAMDRVLGSPTTCPHGNPIPGHSKPVAREVRLARLATGSRAAITRVSEVAEREAPRLLAYLFDRGLTPGRKLQVLEVDDVGRTLRLRAGDADVTLSHETAGKLWVVPANRD